VIAVSEDDGTVRLSDQAGALPDDGEELLRRLEVDEAAIHDGRPADPHPERTLLLGWNERGAAIVNELDRYVAAGSELLLVADVPGPDERLAAECGELKNQKLAIRRADTTSRRVLDGLDVPGFDQIILLCYSDALGVQEADAWTLITLLHLRDIAEQGGHDFRIVSEMLDVRNRDLAEVTQADDFIVSNKLTSLMLAQISENRELSAVFADLFDPTGSEIYLKPAGDYVETGRAVSFYTVVEAARRRGEVAFGYRRAALAKDAANAYGVVINPRKPEKVTLAPADQVIVLAQG
jgi:hypothetical protein